MQKIIILFCLLSLTACSGMNFQTNIGPYASNRVKSVIVREYSIEEIGKYDAHLLGNVEAALCQERIDEAKPNRAALVRDMKVRTHNLGGNGVVVEGCSAPSTYAGCLIYLECRGLAYAVPERQSRP